MRFFRSRFLIAIITILLLFKPLKKIGHAFLLRSDLGQKTLSVLETFGFYQKYAQPKILRPEYVDMLYQTLLDVHYVLSKTKVRYFIDFGTLLGAVRHGGFIPWDDDLDLSLIPEDVELFLTKAVPLLKALGYTIEKGEGFNGVCVKRKDFVLKPQEKLSGCDIFFPKDKGDFLDRVIGAKIEKKDLLPLKEYCFGPLKVFGPSNPTSYLNAEYGKNWAKVAEMGLDHHLKTEHQPLKKIPFSLTNNAPALPSRKLRDPEETLWKMMHSDEKKNKKEF